jgi:hypothetical protein
MLEQDVHVPVQGHGARPFPARVHDEHLALVIPQPTPVGPSGIGPYRARHNRDRRAFVDSAIAREGTRSAVKLDAPILGRVPHPLQRAATPNEVLAVRDRSAVLFRGARRDIEPNDPLATFCSAGVRR